MWHQNRWRLRKKAYGKRGSGKLGSRSAPFDIPVEICSIQNCLKFVLYLSRSWKLFLWSFEKYIYYYHYLLLFIKLFPIQLGLFLSFRFFTFRWWLFFSSSFEVFILIVCANLFKIFRKKKAKLDGKRYELKSLSSFLNVLFEKNAISWRFHHGSVDASIMAVGRKKKKEKKTNMN